MYITHFEISVNMKNFIFSDQISPKNMNEKNIEKKEIKIVISIQQYNPVPNSIPLYQISVNLKNFKFSDQICPKNMNGKNFEKKKKLKSS